MTLAWRGVFPAATTQFSVDFAVDIAATLRHMDVMIESGVHGLIMLGTVGENCSVEFEEKLEVLKVENVRWATAPFEGRFQVQSFSTRNATQTVEIPAGSVFVPAAQRAGKVAMHILEPAAPDSAVRWGFFQSVFEQKEYFSDYVFEPYAVEMLKQNSALKAEFDAKVQSDATFAKNPRARLLWLFQRSPYFEPDKDTYPVVRITPGDLPAVKSALAGR